jgi:hypothetical protein
LARETRILDVALECGFKTQQRFAQVFRNMHGASPTEYRRLTESGPDVSRFRNASAFASWLGLCPDKRVRGGKVLSTQGTEGEEPSSHRAPARCQIALRAKDYCGAFFHRMRARLGTAQAITATAHKLARVVYHVLHGKEPYTETVFRPAMNKNSNEPKCAFAYTPYNSASNSYPSQQIQQLSKLVPEEESRLR